VKVKRDGSCVVSITPTAPSIAELERRHIPIYDWSQRYIQGQFFVQRQLHSVTW
jgi:hypothetical protein